MKTPERQTFNITVVEDLNNKLWGLSLQNTFDFLLKIQDNSRVAGIDNLRIGGEELCDEYAGQTVVQLRILGDRPETDKEFQKRIDQEQKIEDRKLAAKKAAQSKKLKKLNLEKEERQALYLKLKEEFEGPQP